MAACPGCVACASGPESYLCCDACATASDPARPYAVYAHARREGLGYTTEIRPVGGAPALVYRMRARARRLVPVPVCPACGGELVRR